MNLYNFDDYKNYLNNALALMQRERGIKAKLARYLGCQSGFISQVLNGTAHFGLEHSIKINNFLGHDEDKSHFFMLLVQLAKAGSGDLKRYYKSQLDKILNERKLISNRLKSGEKLSKEAHETYYSEWYYAAVHIILSIPTFNNPQLISSYLNLDEITVLEVLNFLIHNGLAIENEGKFKIGNARIHIPNNTTHVNRHHTNWRVQILKDLDRNKISSLHYSLVMTVSRDDFEKIRELLIESIEKTEKIIGPSNEEKICFFGLDFYEL